MNNAFEMGNVRSFSEEEQNFLINQILGICVNQLPAHLTKSLAPALMRFFSADDIAQETFLKATQNLEQFEYQGEKQLFGWLISIANNIALSELRRAKSRQTSSLSDSFVDLLFDSGLLSPSKQFSLKENKEILAKCIEQLNDLQKKVVHARYFENQKFVEIAAELDKSAEQVRGLHRNAMKRLVESFRLVEKLRSSRVLKRP